MTETTLDEALEIVRRQAADRAAKVKMPPRRPSDDERPEIEPFMLGFALCMKAIGRHIPIFDKKLDDVLFDEAAALANEFYPPFDLPRPTEFNPRTFTVSK